MTNKEQFQKIQEALSSLAGLPEDMREVKKEVKDISKTLTGVQIEYARKHERHATQINDIKSDINGLGTKVRKHLDSHWTWLAGSAGLVGAILAAAKYLSG